MAIFALAILIPNFKDIHSLKLTYFQHLLPWKYDKKGI